MITTNLCIYMYVTVGNGKTILLPDIELTAGLINNNKNVCIGQASAHFYF